MGPSVAACGRDRGVGSGREERARVRGSHGDKGRVYVSGTAVIAGDEERGVA